MAPDILDRPTVYGARAKLGVIVPPTNTANEAEWNRMAPDGVSIHAARMPLHTDTTSPDGKKALYHDLRRFSRDLAQASVDVIAYGCTAGSMVSPMTAPSDFMTAETGVPAVTTAAAIIDALRALGVERAAVATPYHDALNAHEVSFLAENGIETVACAGLGYGAGGPDEYRGIARVPSADVHALAVSVDRPEADALIISCTDFATLDVIPRLEEALDKPVVTSNEATVWEALRTDGIEDRFEASGALLKNH